MGYMWQSLQRQIQCPLHLKHFGDFHTYRKSNFYWRNYFFLFFCQLLIYVTTILFLPSMIAPALWETTTRRGSPSLRLINIAAPLLTLFPVLLPRKSLALVELWRRSFGLTMIVRMDMHCGREPFIVENLFSIATVFSLKMTSHYYYDFEISKEFR